MVDTLKFPFIIQVGIEDFLFSWIEDLEYVQSILFICLSKPQTNKTTTKHHDDQNNQEVQQKQTN